MGWIENITDQLKQAREQRAAEALMVQKQQQEMAQQQRDMLAKGFTSTGGGVTAAPSPHAAPGPGASFMDRLRHGRAESFDTRQRLPQIIQPTYTPDPKIHPELATTGRQAKQFGHEERFDQYVIDKLKDEDRARDWKQGLEELWGTQNAYWEAKSKQWAGKTEQQQHELTELEVERTEKQLEYLDRQYQNALALDKQAIRKATLEGDALKFSLENDQEMASVRQELERLGLTAKKLEVGRSGMSLMELKDGRMVILEFDPSGKFNIQHLPQFDPKTNPGGYLMDAMMNYGDLYLRLKEERGDSDLAEQYKEAMTTMFGAVGTIHALQGGEGLATTIEEKKEGTYEGEVDLETEPSDKPVKTDKSTAVQTGEGLPEMSEEEFDQVIDEWAMEPQDQKDQSGDSKKKNQEKVSSPSIPDDVMSLHVSGLMKEKPMGIDYTGKNLTQKNLNPGNIKYKPGGVANKYAKKDAKGEPMRDRHGHLIFESAEMGWKAFLEDLSRKLAGRSKANKTWVPQGATLRVLGEGLNPGTYGNQRYATDPTWADSVATILGVSPDVKISDISLGELAGAIATQEGWTAKNVPRRF